MLGNRGSRGPTDRQFQLEVLAEIRQFDDIWSLGLGLFGIHLLLIGWLAFTSGFVPRIIGVLVAIAGAGYLIDSLGGLLYVPSFELATLTFIGEVVLMVWLLVSPRAGRSTNALPRMITTWRASVVRQLSVVATKKVDLEVGEDAGLDAGTDVVHQTHDESLVVDGAQRGCEHLLGLEQMMQVRLGVTRAGVAVAVFVNR